MDVWRTLNDLSVCKVEAGKLLEETGLLVETGLFQQAVAVEEIFMIIIDGNLFL